MEDIYVENLLTLANVNSTVQLALTKVGLEYIPPMDESVVEEVILETLTTGVSHD